MQSCLTLLIIVNEEADSQSFSIRRMLGNRLAEAYNMGGIEI